MSTGDKVVYQGIVRPFWFNSVIENAKYNLVVGYTYTIKEIKRFSSYTIIKLKETGNLNFNSAWFREEK